jgi:hypothetical protein
MRTPWLGVGSASLENAREACDNAAGKALGDRDDGLLIRFTADSNDLEQINGCSNGVPRSAAPRPAR